MGGRGGAAWRDWLRRPHLLHQGLDLRMSVLTQSPTVPADGVTLEHPVGYFDDPDIRSEVSHTMNIRSYRDEFQGILYLLMRLQGSV